MRPEVLMALRSANDKTTVTVAPNAAVTTAGSGSSSARGCIGWDVEIFTYGAPPKVTARWVLELRFLKDCRRNLERLNKEISTKSEKYNDNIPLF